MSEWPESIGLVGCGAMGTAMAIGLLRAHPHLASSLVLVDAAEEAVQRARDETGGSPGSPEAAAQCDLVVLAVKPKDAEGALDALAGRYGAGTVLLSVVAGWGSDRLAAAAPGAAVVRTMPNLAVRTGHGLIAVSARDLPEPRRAALLSALEPLGTVVEMPEHLLGPATALAGSGPGFVALVAEGLEDGAVAVGFPRTDARRMVQAVLAGTASLLADGDDPAELRQRVSSPSGTTIEGVAVLERGGVRAHLADAVRAAARRAGELA